ITVSVGGSVSLTLSNGVPGSIDLTTLIDDNYLLTVTMTNNVGASNSFALNVDIINKVSTLSGRVLSPGLITGDVAIYKYKNHVIGEILGEGKTNNNGDYSIDIRTNSTPVLVMAKNGNYTEPASGSNVSLQFDQFFSAVTNYTIGIDAVVSLTPYSTFAHARSQYLSSLGVDDVSAIDSANNAFISITGTNYLSVLPLNVADASNITFALTDGHKLGFLLSGLSRWTLNKTYDLSLFPHQFYNIASLTKAVYDDVLDDGVVGAGSGVQISLGDTPINSDLLRHQFAIATMEFINSASNLTTLDNTKTIGYIKSYNNNTNPIFNSSVVISFNEDNPKIVDISPPGGISKNGVFSFQVGVQDFVGLTSGKLYRDGILIENLKVFKTKYQALVSNGIDTKINALSHNFHFVFENADGQIYTSPTYQIKYDNDGPVYPYAKGTNQGAIDKLGRTAYYELYDSNNNTCNVLLPFKPDVEKNYDAVLGGYTATYLATADLVTGYGSATCIIGDCTSDYYELIVNMGTSGCIKAPGHLRDAAGNDYQLPSFATQNYNHHTQTYIYVNTNFVTQGVCYINNLPVGEVPTVFHPDCPN
ncbi:MAG: hypothetical protein OEZ01_18390, partial [Candidatus Heimdallarchaeota archaeon]|nr:hypothetical protein [Candidatus Heimdallarchaeota archaeon]